MEKRTAIEHFLQMAPVKGVRIIKMKNKIVLFIIIMLMNCMVVPVSADRLEYIYTQNDKIFSSQGSWSPGEIGYQLGEAIYANAGEGVSAQWSLGVEAGKKYTIYVWRVLKDKGCPNAQIDIELTGEKFTVPFSMARGMIGWTNVGCYDLPDGRANIKVSGKTGTLIVSAIRLVEGEVSDEEEAGEAEIAESDIPNLGDDVVVLKVGNTKAYKAGKAYTLDAAAKIAADRTFVPVRFVSECLGAKVEWNESTEQATVQYGEKSLVFKKGSAEYTVDGEKRQLEAEIFIDSDRMMLPVRAVGEEMNQLVLWDNSGVIVICPSSYSADKQQELTNSAVKLY